MDRLSPATLGSIPDSILKPRYDRNRLHTGIVHLGIGAFHRAHQAYYTEALLNQCNDDDLQWGIVGCSLRSKQVPEQMHPQMGLYTLVENSDAGSRYQVVGCVQDAIAASDQSQEIIALLSNPDVKIVSLTITEKGYCHDPATGALNTQHPDIIHDFNNPAKPRTALGYIMKALQNRQREGAPGFTLLSCDNLPSNGRVLKNVIFDFIEAIQSALIPWVEQSVSFPCTMIDRIVPATTEEDKRQAETILGVRDEALVCTEAFSQWVIEDDFLYGRPNWEAVGATFVEDVDAFEVIKLRLLNGAHSLIAYTGYLSGFKTIAEVMKEPAFTCLAREFLDKEVTSSVDVPEGFDIKAYKNQLIERFSNPALQHRTWQIAMDGSQKIPQRWLATLRYQVANSGETTLLSLGLAAWIRYVTGKDDAGNTIDVSDPWAERLREIALSTNSESDLVDKILSIKEIFSTDLCQNHHLKHQITEYLRAFSQQGVGATIRSLY